MSDNSNNPLSGEGRIRWERQDFSIRGFVGDLSLFSVGYQSRGRYYARTSLPGFKRDLNRPTEDEAKALCETLLDRFVERIAATWPERSDKARA